MNAPQNKSPLATPAPVHGIANKFSVCAKDGNILIHGILTKNAIALPADDAVNLAQWIAAHSYAAGMPLSQFVEGVVQIMNPGSKRLEEEESRLRILTLQEAMEAVLDRWMVASGRVLTTDVRVVEVLEWLEATK